MIDSGHVVDTLDDVRASLTAAPDAAGLRPIGLAEVVTGPGALASLPAALRRRSVPVGTEVAVLTDATSKRGPEGDLLESVLGLLGKHHVPRAVVVGARSETVHADEETVQQACQAVRGVEPSALVTLGSGTVADLGKVVAAELGVPHVVVQTAASVNGYADDQSVLLLRGTKRTTPSAWPDVLVSDPDVLALAPVEMTRSGLGDQLSMFTAAADWYLADAVGFDDSFSSSVVDLMRGGAEGLLDAAPAIGSGDRRAVALLTRALTAGGLAMGVAGRTAPSSGGEHAISHLLEMRATAAGRQAAAHGAQVGVASVVVAELWQRTRDRLRRGGARVRALDPERMRVRVEEAFVCLDATGGAVEECWSAYRRKLSWINSHQARLQQVCDSWPEHDRVLVDLLAPASTISTVLRQAGAAADFVSLDPAPDPEVATWAVRNAHLMRDRFGILDLAEVIGAWTEEDTHAVCATVPA